MAFVICGRLIQIVTSLFLNIYRQELRMHSTSLQYTELQHESKAIWAGRLNWKHSGRPGCDLQRGRNL